MTYLYYFTYEIKKRNLILIFQYEYMMLQLLKIIFIAFSLLISASISHAYTCSKDVRECSNLKLCKKTTKMENGEKSWDNDTTWVLHLAEAKRRNLTCGIIKNTAIKTNNKKIIYPKCRINNSINCYGEIKYSDSSFYFGEISPKNIRNGLGLYIYPNGDYWVGSWKNNNFRNGEKASAKRAFKYNGFNTFPLSERKKAQKVLSDLGFYNSSIDGQFGKNTFIGGARFLVEKKSHLFFKETIMSKTGSIETYRSVLNYGKLLSNKRKSNSTNTLFKIETASFNRSDFSRLNVTQRKQLQYGLKQLGFYRSSVDGLYGAGTEKAVRLYARSKGIKSGFPNSIFNKIVSEVNVPSSFTVATKPNPKPKPKSKAASKSGCRSILSILTGIDELCIDRPYNPSSSGLSVDWPEDPLPYIGTSNSCISDVNCDYGYVCIKRVGRGGQCMKKPRNSNRNFEPKSCTRDTQCGIGNKCDRTYRVCVER